jgi:DNA-3-methyladenine glycosylase
MKLQKEFYTREDTLIIARELLGKYVYTNFEGTLTGGIIVETEAYIGPHDAGSHAFNGRRTPRNETMYAEGGVTYMYICYGIHDMLNIVTGPTGSSHAILIRAIEPTDGIAAMQQRRGNVPLKRLATGPGALAKALGLKKHHDAYDLSSSEIWIEDKGLIIPEEKIKATGRVGLGCKDPYLTIPWRFIVDGNPFVSKGPK